VVAGLLLGWGALVSPRVLVLLPLAAVLLFGSYSTRRSLAGLALFLAGMAVVLAPWTVRNYRCYNEVIPTTTNGGINLYIGNNPYATGGYHLPAPDLRPPYPFYDSRRWFGEALRYVAANPGQTAGRMLTKALRFWNPHFGDQFVVMLLFVIGWVRYVRWKGKSFDARRTWVLLVPFALMAVHMVFFVQPRYMIPVLPFVCVVAGAGVFGWNPVRGGSGTDARPATQPV
jgi:hypothetical protein